MTPARSRPRTLLRLLALLALGLAPLHADTLDALSAHDAASGLRSALAQSVDRAVRQLGAPDGFLNNARVTIPLPPAFQKLDSVLRLMGRGGDAEALRASLNHAAENAVSEAAPVLMRALKRMTLADAKGIIAGGDDAATSYFRQSAGEELKATFRPVVARATARVQLAARYDEYAGKAAQYGLMSSTDANMNEYVTARALDGLFVVMADEERAIRKDPLGQASAIIRKVFGAH